jgi:hypothetical protein
MPTAKKTDLQVLRALLSMPAGKLTPSEKRVFQEMYDKLATGHILNLSPKQRMWADSIYDKHDLDKERPPARTIAIVDKSLAVKHPLDKLALPKRPPGKS